MITLTIPGPPIPKARPRVLKTGRTYTPKRTADYEKAIQTIFLQTYPGYEPTDKPLFASVRCFVPIPKSFSKRKHQDAVRGDLRPIRRNGDNDNLYKSVTDSLNGLAYRDDCQIVESYIGKWYSEQPRVEIEISEI